MTQTGEGPDDLQWRARVPACPPGFDVRQINTPIQVAFTLAFSHHKDKPSQGPGTEPKYPDKSP